MIDRYADSFRDEAEELLSELEEALLELEQQPRNTEIIDRAFRALHTIKGAAGMTGFDTVEAFVHEVETVFEMVRSGQLEGNLELVNLTLAVRDQIKLLIEAAFGKAEVDEAETARLVSALRDLPGVSPKVPQETEGTAEAPPPAGEFKYLIHFRPPIDIFQRGIQPTSLLRELARLGDCRVTALTENMPPLEELDPELCYLAWDLILTTDAGEDAIRDLFIFIEGDFKLEINRVDAEDSITTNNNEKLGEILIKHGDLSPDDLEQTLHEQPKLGEVLVEAGLVTVEQVSAALGEQGRPVQRGERHRLEETSSIRVRSEKLDSLVNLVGELVTVQARLSRTANEKDDPNLIEIAEIVEHLTWEMRDHILNIRMLPIGTTFNRFRRLVRDLSRELGKETDLLTIGAETELDKTVIERLGDPLVHLLRNAVDHGIETVEARQIAGKPKRGTISLSAAHSGAKIVIEVKDDGRGLDKNAIKSRAQKLELLNGDQELDDKALFALIFTPGFSTAGKVSSLSGRGVGMDVVKRTIDSLQGSIEVASEPGKGTTFIIKLPLTLAIIDGLMVEVSEEVFVLPLSAVEECIELTRAEATNSGHLITVRGEIIPYLRLRERFEVCGEPPEIEQIVIAEVDGRRIGISVDRVIGEHQTVIKSLGKMYRDIKGISGATILGDGTVALILDLPPLVREAEQDERSRIEARQG
jgi:two-component system chemotaxis sensor kinase CheA